MLRQRFDFGRFLPASALARVFTTFTSVHIMRKYICIVRDGELSLPGMGWDGMGIFGLDLHGRGTAPQHRLEQKI